MKTIKITTSQNVVITYKLASTWERIIAFFLDAVVLTASALIVYFLIAFTMTSVTDVMVYFTVIPIIVLYSLCFELFNHGQSLGKMILKIRVIRLDGEKTGFFDYLMRWIFRALDIYVSVGSVAILSIVSSNYNQRLGDLLANTIVVNVGQIERINYEQLLRIEKMQKDQITYPQVVRLSEESMLVVKETLAKHMEFGNEAYEKALQLLSRKMEKELSVKAREDKRVFLKTLLKDYISLTR